MGVFVLQRAPGSLTDTSRGESFSAKPDSSQSKEEAGTCGDPHLYNQEATQNWVEVSREEGVCIV